MRPGIYAAVPYHNGKINLRLSVGFSKNAYYECVENYLFRTSSRAIGSTIW